MDKKEFFVLLQDIFRAPLIEETTNLLELEYFNSIAILQLIEKLADKNISLDVVDIVSCSSADELYSKLS